MLDRRVGLLLVGGLAALLLVVLRAPIDVLAALRLSGDAPAVANGPTSDLGASVAEPPQTMPDVAPDVAAEVAAEVGPSPASPAGRWGEPAARPVGPGLLVEELRGGWRVEAGAEEAAALGVLAAHGWARRQTSAAWGAGTTVTLEAVERPGAQHAVVTVLVASPERVQRLAVPITFGTAGPVVAGTPWALPSPSTTVDALSGAAIGDEVLIAAARDALERVGIDGARLRALEVTDGWPFIARLTDDHDGHPWLRWHLDRFVVTGLPLDRAEDRIRLRGTRGEP